LAVQVTAALVVIVFAAGILGSGDQVQVGWLKFFSLAVLIATLALGAWDRWIWRWPIIQKFRRVPVDISGTWRGTLSSLWVDPSTGKAPLPKDAFLVVRQTSSTASVRLLSDEAHSHSSLAKVLALDGVSSFEYVFHATPDASVEHKSRAHRGAGSLMVSGRPATRLQGRYWTDRHSHGEADFRERRSSHADNYDDAVRLFGSA